jgi:putative membrane protein
MNIIIKLLVMALSVLAAAYLLPDATVESFWMALVVAIVIALLDATVGRLLRVVTLPLNWITLGLVSFIITVLMVMLASNLLDGFEVSGFLTAIFFAIITSIVSMILENILIDKD